MPSFQVTPLERRLQDDLRVLLEQYIQKGYAVVQREPELILRSGVRTITVRNNSLNHSIEPRVRAR